MVGTLDLFTLLKSGSVYMRLSTNFFVAITDQLKLQNVIKAVRKYNAPNWNSSHISFHPYRGLVVEVVELLYH